MRTTTFKFDEKTMQVLEELRALTGSSTNSETVRAALRAYKEFVDAKYKRNERIILRPEDEGKPEKEVILP